MASVTSEGVAGADRRAVRRLRAAVLGPRGGGTTRRRASDAFRLRLAIAVVAVSVPVMRANSAAELKVVRALHPPPAAISWLVTSVFWLGSAGVAVLLAVVGLLVPRLTAVRWTAVATVLTWGVCIVLGAVLGPAAGRPPVSELAGLNAGYPVTQLAVAIAVASTAFPYLSCPVHRMVWFLVAVAVLAGVCGGHVLPVNAISSMALGWGVAAGDQMIKYATAIRAGAASTEEILRHFTRSASHLTYQAMFELGRAQKTMFAARSPALGRANHRSDAPRAHERRCAPRPSPLSSSRRTPTPASTATLRPLFCAGWPGCRADRLDLTGLTRAGDGERASCLG